MKRLTLVAGLLFGSAALCGLTAWRVGDAMTRRADAAEATAVATSVPVDVMVAAPRDLVETVRVAGTLRARHEADVVADVPGRVEAILADVGTQVRKGDILARLESRDAALQVEQAQASLAMAEAGRETALRDYTVAQAVAGVGGITDAQLVAARSRSASSDAQVLQAKAALGMARERLADATLRSPIDGVVTHRATDVGRMVSPGVAAFVVQDLGALELVVSVDERTAARLQAGGGVTIVSDHATDIPAASVRTVSPALDAQTRKAEVVIELGAVAGLLPHGTATAVLLLGQRAGAVAVPARAVLEGDDGAYLYVVDGTLARRTPVRPGLRDGEWLEVDGLPAGATVVVAGQTFLTDGGAVSPRTPAPTPVATVPS
ncbi:MAG: efflux RND transporter periplasmic adaptor subunit [Pseudomonadota bacterium]|nr:efflux RND transporter periplasmic adaptor subunit [Pseudomonadota bacterium]